jgi:DNA-binding HxlR family transcriptional regulator
MAKKKQEEEVEELELDDEELVEDEEPDEAPAQDEVVFGASDLAKAATKLMGKEITARQVRVLLRKMARDGRIEREIKQGNRTRYSWTGPKDPEVKMILKAIKDGELEQGQKEALEKLKAQKAEKKAAAEKTGKKGKKGKKAPEPEPEDDADEDDDVDFELDDDDDDA